ncbi:hypothetical protein Acr_24g0009910 [Actinidia rufa]|uniref:Uncharacterized protein n=1 Tax=Actinidia rufa TaxID=165716 RepID=A0A7J0GVN9_9ERIC|nr:hypothetical protein Acr_24g0009910 [Actinidia rufa]
MDEQSNSADANSHSGGQQLETSKAERAIWLMKCPPVVSRSLQCPPPSSEFASLFDSSRPVAKVVVSIDPLCSNDQSSSQVRSFIPSISRVFKRVLVFACA